MGKIWSTNESVIFVGGRGTKAGDANAGGGCTKDVWGDLKAPSLSLSNVMGTNGEPVSDPSAWNGSATACTVTQSSAGKLLITKTGAFTDVIAVPQGAMTAAFLQRPEQRKATFTPLLGIQGYRDSARRISGRSTS